MSPSIPDTAPRTTPEELLKQLIASKAHLPEGERYRVLAHRILGLLEACFRAAGALIHFRVPPPLVVDPEKTPVARVVEAYEARWAALVPLDTERPGPFTYAFLGLHESLGESLSTLLGYLEWAEAELPMVEQTLKFSLAIGSFALIDNDPDNAGFIYADWRGLPGAAATMAGPLVVLVRGPESPMPTAYRTALNGATECLGPADDVLADAQREFLRAGSKPRT